MRTHTKETTSIQDLHHPTTNSTWCSTPHLKHKTKIQTQPSADRIITSLSLAHQRKNKQRLSTSLTLYEAYANHCTNLRGAETNGRKNAVLKTEKRRPQTQYILKNNEKAKKYYTNEGTN